MLEIITTVFHVIFSLGLIVSVILMSGRSAGLSGAIAGGAETFFGKRKGMDDLLGKVAAGLAIAFLVTSLILTVMRRAV